MFAIAIIVSLTTFLVFILATIAYLVSVIIDDSNDDPAASTLGLDTQDFSRTPVMSPADYSDPLAEVNSDELREFGPPCNCLKAMEAASHANRLRRPASNNDAINEMTQTTKSTLSGSQQDDVAAATATLEADQQLLQGAALLAGAAAVIAGPEEIQSAEMNSRLLKLCASQREPPDGRPTSTQSANGFADGQASGQQQQANEMAAGLSSWHSSASAQKSIISGQLGSVVSKQIFDDFDTREMQLGGTALHWCKTRKSLDRLLKLGMPLDIVNKRHETALHVAVRRHKLQVLIGLLNHGANLESRNESGETPLVLAARVNDIFAVQMLLIYDADFEARDNQNQTARHHSASICDRHKAQQLLPSAAHLVLAMLNEIGAKRCAASAAAATSGTAAESNQAAASSATCAANTTNPLSTNPPPAQVVNGGGGVAEANNKNQFACTDGCAPTGTYNGNSYSRWPSFERESCYRRCLFSDLIESKRAELKGRATRVKQGKKEEEEEARGVANSRMLCMDGGGLRGVIVCQIMIEMEKYLKRPVLSYFDWVGGTSVGAFLACALSLGSSLQEMRRVCFEFKDEVFSGGRPYNSKFLERVLKRTLGAKTRLSDVKRVRLAFATVLADREPCQLKIFRNYRSPVQLLEAHGLSPEHYDNMSGHTAVATGGRRNTARRISETNPSGGKAPDKQQAVKSVVVSSSNISTQNNKAPTNNVPAISVKSTAKNVVESSNSGKQEATGETGGSSSKSLEVVKSLKTVTKVEQGVQAAVVAAVLAKDIGEPVLDENDRNPIVWQAVRASAAAPFFFRPYGPYLDGGIISNNPTIDIMTEFYNYHKVRHFVKRHARDSAPKSPDGKDFSPEPVASDQIDVVVSLGTGRGRVIGRQAMVDFGQIASGLSAVFSPVELVRSIRAARDLFKRLMQQSCHTDDHILDRAQAWCASLNVPYFRLNPPLATIFSIDDKRDEQLINALWQTKLYMLSMKEQLTELAELLEGPVELPPIKPAKQIEPTHKTQSPDGKREQGRQKDGLKSPIPMILNKSLE